MNYCSFSGKKYKNIIFSIFVFCVSIALCAQGAGEVYVVQKGDTLYSISRKYDVSIEDLYSANGLTKSSVIRVGQRISIPSPQKSTTTQNSSGKKRSFDVYTVQKGDTLYHIATINDITVEQLKSFNGISDTSVLLVGQQLKIPVSSSEFETSELPNLPYSETNKTSSEITKETGDASLVWPVKNPSVTYTKGKSNGVQLSAQENESVHSIRAGTVMYVGNYRGYGQVVFVQDKTGYIYAYTGLGSVSVKKGDYVIFGDALGTAGLDGIKGTSQITLMVYKKSSPIDPAKAPRG